MDLLLPSAPTSPSKSSSQWHRPVLQALVRLLWEVMCDDQYADQALHRTLKSNRRFGSRDRHMIASTFYEIVRHWRKQMFLAGIEVDHPGEQEITQLVEGFLEGSTSRMSELKSQSFAVQESYPDWLVEKFKNETEDHLALMRELNREAPVFIRANTLKTTAVDLKKQLAREGVSTEIVDTHALLLSTRRNLLGLEAFQAGLFEIQDLGSQSIGSFLDPQPGERIIDACAGAGGKTLHMAALMQNSGRIVALDVADGKLTSLKLRARRAGVSNVEIHHLDSTKVIKRLHGSADRVLLDVPCTATGVLRRQVDTKWKLKPEIVEDTMVLQAQILREYSKMVKPGGVLVYATCSVFRCENTKQIEAFLQQSDQFVLESSKSIRPGERGADGFFMAKLRRLPK